MGPALFCCRSRSGAGSGSGSASKFNAGSQPVWDRHKNNGIPQQGIISTCCAEAKLG